MRALITGATGFIGRRLLPHVDRPVVLCRDTKLAQNEFGRYGVQAYEWDSMKGLVPDAALDGVDTVFHLAGEPVAGGRWTDERKRRIRESRVEGTRQLVLAIGRRSERPRVMVSASAVGYYGDRGDEVLAESAAPGSDFLAEVCVAWEREAEQAARHGVRIVRVRIGIVLGAGGGALAKLLPPFKLGLGGPLGNGRQWMPWIHIDDVVSLLLHAATATELAGPVNGVAPQTVTNGEFTRAMAAAVHRPAILPAPYFLMRMVMGEFAEVLFASQRTVPKAASASGFQFRYPDIESALRSIV